jgi:hypothetical protein
LSFACKNPVPTSFSWFKRGFSTPLSKLEARERRLYAFFVVQFLAVTFFQKLAIPIGEDSGVSLALPTMFGGAGLLLICGDLRCDPERLLIFSIFVLTTAISHILIPMSFSLAGLLLFISIYLFLPFYVAVSPDLYKKILLIFQSLMLAASVIAILQDLWQLFFAWPEAFDLDNFIPSGLLFPGFTYIQPLYYGSAWIKPPGFFLEVSFLSQYCAAAIVIEVLLFRRIAALILFSLGMLSTFAGTGPLTLMIVSPFLISKLSVRALVICGAAIICGTVVYAMVGGADPIVERLEEFATPDTSAYDRFVSPVLAFSDYFREEGWIYSGIGAGNILKAPNIIWWAPNKIFHEYGLFVTCSWYGLLVLAMFKKAPSAILALAVFAIFNFMGGYLAVPPMAFLLMLVTTMLRLETKAELLARRSRPAYHGPVSEAERATVYSGKL